MKTLQEICKEVIFTYGVDPRWSIPAAFREEFESIGSHIQEKMTGMFAKAHYDNPDKDLEINEM